ncbi:MAG: MaoC family dehydratase [Actinobacteria bacterium]|nr:MaoC family dehydratase [Actinomycetota bacterium]
MRTFEDVDAFCAAVGEHLGDSPWLLVDQYRINQFADATGDHQWIHVDPERAANGPFGTTIAHGYLTLSLVPVLLADVFAVENLQAFVNYGANKIRFLRPVPVDSRIQASATLASIEETPMGVRATVNVEVRLDDGGKPACIAETIILLVR